jgi:hypothetical protein
MTFSCFLCCSESNDISVTRRWLKSSGLPSSYAHSDRSDVPVFVDFFSVPPALSQFSLLGGSLTILCISALGVSFYLCDAVFRDFSKSDEDQRFISIRPDGMLFVPMSNIISINFFGHVSRQR